MVNSSQRCAGFLVIGSLLAVWAAESSVRADPEETKNQPAIEADKLEVGKYRGLIVSAPNEGGLFRVAVEYPRVRIKPGKEKEVAEFLKSALPLVDAEPGTVSWFAIQEGPSSFAIFDTFDDENGRNAHLNGKVAAALMAKAGELLAKPPAIHRIHILAGKLPKK